MQTPLRIMQTAIHAQQVNEKHWDYFNDLPSSSFDR